MPKLELQNQNLLGFNIVVSEYIPKDKIIMTTSDTMMIATFDYDKLIWQTTPSFKDALNIIKDFYLERLFRRADYLFHQN